MLVKFNCYETAAVDGLAIALNEYLHIPDDIALETALKEVHAWKEAGAIKYALHPEYHPPKLFPFFANDNVDTLVKRYFNIFPVEAQAVIDLSKKIENSRDGWTQARTAIMTTNLPTVLVGILHQMDPDFLRKGNPDREKNFQKIFSAAPKLFSKGV